MNKKFLFTMLAINGLFFLYMIGRESELEVKLENLKLNYNLTVEELMFAYSMLTSEEKRMVFEKFQANEAFLKVILPRD